MNRIITISREFGSGGRTIGKMTAEKLGIPCFDTEIIEKLSEKSGYAKKFIKEEEKSRFSLFFYDRSNGLAEQDKLWNLQSQVILEIAEKGPCVIVGRCADYILKDKQDCLNVFIHADIPFRAKRIVEEYGERAESPEQRIKSKDKARGAYHRFYTDMKWGHAQNYDVCLNSGKLGIEKCVEILCGLY